MTLTVTLVAVSIAVLAGCGGGGVTVPKGPIKLTEMRADTRPYYWVGESFDGFELTVAEPYEGRRSHVIYGTCEAPTGLGVESACPFALEVQNMLCEDGSAVVTLFSHGGGLSARAARALRPLNEAARRAGRPRVTFDRSVLC